MRYYYDDRKRKRQLKFEKMLRKPNHFFRLLVGCRYRLYEHNIILYYDPLTKLSYVQYFNDLESSWYKVDYFVRFLYKDEYRRILNDAKKE